jgi:hypothetical protein
MRFWTRCLASLGLSCFATAAFAQVGTTSPSGPAAFDGTYVGVSAQFTGAMGSRHRGCSNFPAPASVQITNGHAQGRWASGILAGDVTPTGSLTMRAENSARFDGQIDARGMLTGGINGYCSYSLSWQKR